MIHAGAVSHEVIEPGIFPIDQVVFSGCGKNFMRRSPSRHRCGAVRLALKQKDRRVRSDQLVRQDIIKKLGIVVRAQSAESGSVRIT